jgi:hypothetical protein
VQCFPFPSFPSIHLLSFAAIFGAEDSF